ncbi:hypothetical protein SOVF_089490 [Spinacia oleracea]|uniref:Uncharacterized protein n=1 Tax=Spinacia oleracea TaxID=3562 RepID=A0A9R0IMX1_SPIOL|nr:uncharacterized protein LOC110791875 [Spinacia oleracea]KNA16359.1 hypothetical protein SOVF_089490 [Spinacia oleracea]
MEPETLLNLYDSFWFDLDLFNRKNPRSFHKIPDLPPSNPDIPTLPTIKTNTNFSLGKKRSESPNSVLFSPKLQTLFSGKISEDFDPQEMTVTTPKTGYSPLKGNLGRRKKKGLSKSLSDLEFEELKGFIDLGFVFSEEDTDSSLASIIPGLHRLKNSSGNTRVKEDDTYSPYASNHDINDNTKNVETMNDGCYNSISRPYLSEAWEVQVLEKKRRDNYMLNWRVPAPDNQVEMKDYLKFWAHSVASAVK